MGLANLPEQFLYQLLPDAVIQQDVRGILAAVVGGYQDRLGDLRSAASSLSDLIDPAKVSPSQAPIRVEYTDANNGDTVVTYLSSDSTTPPAQTFAAPASAAAIAWCANQAGVDPTHITYVAYGTEVLLVQFYGPKGNTINTTLDVDGTTPTGSDNSALTSWAASQLQIDPTALLSVQYGSDVLRTVDGNFLQQLAASVGALIPVTQAATQDEQIEIQRQLVMSYFPRLRIKGTITSYELLARNLGFDDIRVIPLWSRLSPRRPEDYGNPENEDDFAASPEYIIAPTLPDPFYDPQVFRDGVFVTWPSVTDPVQFFSGNPSDTNYLPNAINDRSPFITVAPISGSQIIGIPNSGSYIFQGGDFDKQAYVLFPEANMIASAIAPGAGFNGMVVTAQMISTGSGSLTHLSITDRLSAVKYRSSYYDLTFAEDIELAATILVKPNLESTNEGSCQSGLPLTGGTAQIANGSVVMAYGSVVMSQARTAVNPSALQLDIASVQARAGQALDDLESVRPATRQYRKISTGYAISDDPGYAPTPAFYQLFDTRSNAGLSFMGVVPDSAKPSGSYGAQFYLVKNGGTLLMGAESDPANPDIVQLSSGSEIFYGQVYGSYNFSDSSWHLHCDGLAQYSEASVFVQWTNTGFAVGEIDPEPSNILKSQGSINPSERPQDDLEDGSDVFSDDYPWLNRPTVDGALIDADAFNTEGMGETITSVSSTPSLRDQNGVEYQVSLDDSTSSVQPPKVVATMVSTSDSVGGPLPPSYFREAYCFSGSNIYRMGLLNGIPVADPQSFYHTDIGDGLIGWFPFNEHPDDDLTTADLSPLALTDDEVVADYTVSLAPTDRVWNAERGWVLDLPKGHYFDTEKYRSLVSPFFVSFALSPFEATTGVLQDIIVLGATKVRFSMEASDNVAAHARLYAHLLAADGLTQTLVGQADLPVNQFTFVYLNYDGTTATFGTGTVSAAATIINFTAITTAGFDADDTTLFVGNQNGREFLISDLRIYAEPKTLPGSGGITATDRIRNPFKKSVSFTNQSYFPNLTQTELYRFEVLPNGRAYASLTSAPQQNFSTKRAQRYDSTGRFIGIPALDQVGLGGGAVNPEYTYYLGMTGLDVPVRGSVVVINPDEGQPPGQDTVHQPWPLNTPGSYPYVANGTTYMQSASATPWPNPQPNVNPAQQRIFLRGDSSTDNAIFIVTMGSQEGLVYLVAAQVTNPIVDAVSEVAYNHLNGYGRLSVQSTGSGPIVYSASHNGTINRPAAYLYLNNTQALATTGANTISRFIQPNDPTITGPSRSTAGSLEFYNTEALAAGYYIFTLDCGNTGQVDNDFGGFDLTVTIGATSPLTQFTMTALTDVTATVNPRGQTQVQFQLSEALTCPWVLTLAWSNPRSIPAQGILRQFTVYGYELDLVTTQLYKVEASTPGQPATLTMLDTGDEANYSGMMPPSAGAWIGRINSYGQISQWIHEANSATSPRSIVPSEIPDTNYPVSLLRTGSTDKRTEDLTIVTPFLLPDDNPPYYPYISSTSSSGTLSHNGVHFFAGSVTSSGTLFQTGFYQNFYATMQGPLGPTPAPITYGSGTRSSDLTYVWSFWDGSTETTRAPSVSKFLSQGGNLPWSVQAVDELGQSSEYSGYIDVNAAPVFSSLSVSDNDDTTPYTTTLTAAASDPEGNSLLWRWYDLGAGGGSSTLINPSYYPEGSNLVSYPITGTGTDLQVTAIDGNGGTTSLAAFLRGTPILPPVASPISVNGDGNGPSSLGFILNGIDDMYFYVTANDPQSYPIAFAWSASGLAGAVQTDIDNGDGTFTSQLVVPSTSFVPGTVAVSCVITSAPTGTQSPQTTTVSTVISYLNSQIPSINSITVTPRNLSVGAGTNILYSANTTDVQGFGLLNQWNVSSSPSNQIIPYALFSTGTNPVTVPTNTVGGYNVLVTLIVKDPYGLTSTQAAPVVGVTT